MCDGEQCAVGQPTKTELPLTAILHAACKRRRENPSLKRPGRPVGPG
jgi:hypothetical protein